MLPFGSTAVSHEIIYSLAWAVSSPLRGQMLTPPDDLPASALLLRLGVAGDACSGVTGHSGQIIAL
jgi:hypothetical protein